MLVINRPLRCKNKLAYNLPKNMVLISSIKLSVDRCDIIELAQLVIHKMQSDEQMAWGQTNFNDGHTNSHTMLLHGL